MTQTDPGADLPPANPANGYRRRRWRSALAGVALLGIGATGGFAAGTMHGTGWILSAVAHQGFNPERMTKHIDHSVNHVMKDLNATPEQRDEVTGIVNGALTDLNGFGIKPWETRDKFIELLRADTVDPAALEALRAEQVGRVDTASKRMVQAMTEAAQVLTPEQRRQLADRWEHHRHGPHHDRDGQPGNRDGQQDNKDGQQDNK
jgi:protein CpxP